MHIILKWLALASLSSTSLPTEIRLRTPMKRLRPSDMPVRMLVFSTLKTMECRRNSSSPFLPTQPSSSSFQEKKKGKSGWRWLKGLGGATTRLERKEPMARWTTKKGYTWEDSRMKVTLELSTRFLFTAGISTLSNFQSWRGIFRNGSRRWTDLADCWCKLLLSRWDWRELSSVSRFARTILH